MYALKAGILIESVLAILTFIFAQQITWLFTWSSESARIIDDLVLFLRVMWITFPATACGMISSALFQGTGKGLAALIMTLIRTLVFTVPFAWFLGIFLKKGLLGIWIGMVLAGIVYTPIAYGWVVTYIRKLREGDGVSPRI